MNVHNIVSAAFSYFLFYIAAINIYGLFIMGIDKWKSKNRGRRVPEKVLFTVAFIGGAFGVYTGMKLFHHKTLHNRFKYGIPFILVLNIFILGYIYSLYLKP